MSDKLFGIKAAAQEISDFIKSCDGSDAYSPSYLELIIAKHCNDGDADVAKARIDSPKGINCGRCSKPNDWADDCGWFFWHKDKLPLIDFVNYVPVCKSCWDHLGLNTCER